jgi:hypothetical protein
MALRDHFHGEDAPEDSMERLEAMGLVNPAADEQGHLRVVGLLLLLMIELSA